MHPIAMSDISVGQWWLATYSYLIGDRCTLVNRLHDFLLAYSIFEVYTELHPITRQTTCNIFTDRNISPYWKISKLVSKVHNHNAVDQLQQKQRIAAEKTSTAEQPLRPLLDVVPDFRMIPF